MQLPREEDLHSELPFLCMQRKEQVLYSCYIVISLSGILCVISEQLIIISVAIQLHLIHFQIKIQLFKNIQFCRLVPSQDIEPCLLVPFDKATRLIKINFTKLDQQKRFYFLSEVRRRGCVSCVSCVSFF
jgi:hypothetical protein